LMYELDLGMVKTCPHTKNGVLGQCYQKLENEVDRHTQTHKTDANKHSTTPQTRGIGSCALHCIHCLKKTQSRKNVCSREKNRHTDSSATQYRDVYRWQRWRRL